MSVYRQSYGYFGQCTGLNRCVFQRLYPPRWLCSVTLRELFVHQRLMGYIGSLMAGIGCFLPRVIVSVKGLYEMYFRLNRRPTGMPC